MRSALRRVSRVMKAGVVHQLAISLDSLVVNLDATSRSPIAMALIRAERLHVTVSRDGKQFLSVHAGKLVHSSLHFEPTAHFSRRVTLYESVNGDFQSKFVTVTIHNDDMPDKSAMATICKTTVDVASYATSGGSPVMAQVQFEKGTTLLFLTISCVRTDKASSLQSHLRLGEPGRNHSSSLTNLATVAGPVNADERMMLEEMELHGRLQDLYSVPLPPTFQDTTTGGFKCERCGHVWKGADSCLLCRAYDTEDNIQERNKTVEEVEPDRLSEQDMALKRRRLRLPPALLGKRRQRARKIIRKQPSQRQVDVGSQSKDAPLSMYSKRPAKNKDLPAGWKSAVDPKTNKVYYFNTKSGVTTWARPQSETFNNQIKVVTDTAFASKIKKAAIRPAEDSDWEIAVDPKTSKRYYYHRHTGETKWKDSQKTRASSSTSTKAMESRPELVKYQLMIKAGVPPDAVRTKAIQDGVAIAAIDDILTNSKAGTPKAPSAGTASNQLIRADMKLEKYRKMLKAGVPMPAVCEKASQDGLSQADIEVLRGTKTKNVKGKIAPPLLSGSGMKLEKYRKMLKAGVPMPAVCEKASQDGLSQADIEVLRGTKTKNVKGKIAPPLLSGSGMKLEKYRKMLKAGVPMPAVRARAAQDGLNQSDINALTGGNQPIDRTVNGPSHLRSANGLTRLHWEKIDDERLKHSIWGSPSRSGLGVGIDASEEASLKSTFAATKQKSFNLLKSTKRNKSKAQIIDSKRSHNVEISLAKFRDFVSYDDLATSLNRMDFTRLKPEILTVFQSVFPSGAEIRKLKKYAQKHSLTFPSSNGSMSEAFEKISKAEKFLLSLACQVDRGSHKIESMIFLSEASYNVANLKSSIKLIVDACHQVLDCEELVIVLRKILAVGNTMNKGSHVGEVSGFTLESLPRLWSTKGNDKKTTVLDFVVRMLLARDPHLADLPIKLSLLAQAQSLKQTDVASQVQHLEQQFKQQQKRQKDGLFDNKSANQVFKQHLYQVSCLIDDVSLERVKLKNCCDTLANYWGEDVNTCRPERILKTLQSFVVAFQRSVVLFHQGQASARRKATQSKEKAQSNKIDSAGTRASVMLLEMQRRRSLINPADEDNN